MQAGISRSNKFKTVKILETHRFILRHMVPSDLNCLINRENQASIKVAAKLGMTFEKDGKDEKGPFLLYSVSKQPAYV